MGADPTWPLQGTWYNELGSEMFVDPLDPTSQTVTGTYTTAVSSSGCAQGEFFLVGRSDVQVGGQTFGWTVCWLNADTKCWSTTSWAGQYQEAGGNATITALWLLTMRVDPEDEWASTLIGQDLFTRYPPADEAVAQALGARRHSHP
jgi:hypothetical protein